MFTVLPTLVIFVTALVVMSTGLQSESVMVIDPAAAVVPEVQDIDHTSGSGLAGYLVLGLLTALTVYLFTQIQRRRQRWAAMAFSVLVMTLIEGPYAVEEYRYDRQLQQLRTGLQTIKDQRGGYPADTQLGKLASGPFHYLAQPDGSGYRLFWDRPLNPGYAICYASQGDRMWIND